MPSTVTSSETSPPATEIIPAARIASKPSASRWSDFPTARPLSDEPLAQPRPHENLRAVERDGVEK
jgi:hypothetical protein